MRFFSTAFLCLAAIGSAWAQPRITGIANAANYSPSIAQGSIFVVFGSNMGPAQLTQVANFPVPTTLAGTGIRFTPAAGGPFFDALVVYTSAGQLAGILQSQAPTGTYNVTVTYNGQTSAPFQATVVARNFGLISLASSGTGPAVAQIANLNSRVNQFSVPASAGQTIVLYGIGLGPITAPDNNPPGLQDLKGPTNLRVLVGDAEIEPLYAGRSPGIPGLDQINFVLPANVQLGCTVPLRVRVAGTTTGASTTLAIARDGESFCSHPLYNAESLFRLDSGGSLNFGSFALTSQSVRIEVPILGSTTVKQESVSGSFSSVTLANIADVSSSSTAGLFVNVGTCAVYRVLADQSGNVVGGNARLLDAGTSLTLNGPGITNKAVPKAGSTNSYLATLGDPTGGISIPGLPGGIPGQTPSAGISAGSFRLSGTGGTDIGPFEATLNVPTPIVWGNQAALSAAPIIRSSGVRVDWTGGSAADLITIFGISGVRAGGTAENPIYDTATFICNARGDAGNFTVPASILTQLPASTGSITAGTGVGVLALQQTTSSATNGRFNAPLRAGGNIDLGIFTYAIGGLSTVTWQ
jgi:uncharacterized protein (TIGR03437 family)